MFVGDHCGKAEEAIELYVSAFEDSRVVSVERFGPEDEGERGIKHARFELTGEVVAMDSAGPAQPRRYLSAAWPARAPRAIRRRSSNVVVERELPRVQAQAGAPGSGATARPPAVTATTVTNGS